MEKVTTDTELYSDFKAASAETFHRLAKEEREGSQRGYDLCFSTLW